MSDSFLDRLRHGPMLADGAMGTEIFARGVSFDRAPLPEIERVNPLIVREVRRFCDEIDKRVASAQMEFGGDPP